MTEVSTEGRIIGRRLARELTASELEQVGGGALTWRRVRTNVGPGGDSETEPDSDPNGL
jgi:hypothetical protein